MRRWLERVDLLVEEGNFPAAIRLCQTLINQSSNRQKSVIVEKIFSLIFDFLKRSVNSQCPSSGKIEILVAHFKQSINIAFEVLISLGELNSILDSVWNLVRLDSIAKGVYLDSLTESIEAGKISTIPPEILQALCAHLEAEDMLGILERILLRMDIATVDIHQVLIGV